MTPETEKLKDDIDWLIGYAGKHPELMSEDLHSIAAITSAARRYAEVLPLFESLRPVLVLYEGGHASIDEVWEIYGKIAAIVARDEERKQSDD